VRSRVMDELQSLKLSEEFITHYLTKWETQPFFLVKILSEEKIPGGRPDEQVQKQLYEKVPQIMLDELRLYLAL